jgi:hypothetical protein
MALVSYSDSEDSDGGETKQSSSDPQQTKSQQAPSENKPGFQSFVDRSNPRKIRVALPDSKEETPKEGSEDGPPAKRARIGGGAFSGFNALLPAPKRTQPANAAKTGEGSKGLPRQVFSLKTGATPGFDRAADSGFRAESTIGNGTSEQSEDGTTSNGIGQQKESKPPEPVLQGNKLMFKPLSVARKPPPKKAATTIVPAKVTAVSSALPTAIEPKPPPPKVSLFSLGTTQEISASIQTSTSEYEPLLHEPAQPNTASTEDNHYYDERPPISEPQIPYPSTTNPQSSSTSLDTIATDLNLTASERRQLFGRSAKNPATANTAINIVNFNTDAEYAANEAFRAAGETVQHNPVRSIAPGKHSLKQLVNAATNQKDALEESFASGRRNKKEAGSKYGW